MIARLCLIAVLTLLARQATAAGFAPPQVGDRIADRMLFLDGTVLLPPGQWVVAASSTSQNSDVEGSAVASVILFQVGNDTVGGVVIAQGNVLPLKSRPSLSSECWSDDAVFTAVAADDDSGGACTAVMPVTTQLMPSADSGWSAALQFAKAKHWLVPAAYVVTALRSVDRTRLMDVHYALGVPNRLQPATGVACSWIGTSSEPSADMVRVTQGMTNFATAMLAVAETAGHSVLPEIGPAPPMLASGDAAKELAMRLKQARVDELVERGSISQTQAESLYRRAAEPTPSDPLIKELLWRSGYKTLTYKATTYIDTTAVYYFFVPDLPLVMLGSAITNVLGMPLVYVNDFVWSYFGLRASRSKQPFALASLGTACPKQ